MMEASQKRDQLLTAARSLIGKDSLPSGQVCDSASFVRCVLHSLGGQWSPRNLKWNQCFLFDHLPGEISREQLQPGDLVFWSGVYWNPSKPQPPHKIVHVELAIGGGQSTIGVRDRTVEEYPSLSFPSLRFKDIHVHCKSIDPWLHGLFKSACPLHNWALRGSDTIRQTLSDPVHEVLRNWKTFVLGPGNNIRLVKQALLEQGWKQIIVATSKHYRLCWSQTYRENAKLAPVEGKQLSNHIPGLQNVFTSKKALSHLVRKIDDFPAPISYDLADDRDYQAFVSKAVGETWILKPQALNQGIGISLVRNVSEFKAKLAKGDENRLKVIQIYLQPLLLDGYKFDIRFYTAIVRCKPFVAVYYPEYYIRRSLIEYNSDTENLLAHLTNAHQQKSHPDFESRREESILSRSQLSGKLGETLIAHIEEEMVRISVMLFRAAAKETEQRWGCFELIGLDFMLDEGRKVYFIEANTNPALFTDTTVQMALIPRVVTELLQCVTRVHEDRLDFLRGTQFRVLYSEIKLTG